jgi:membrane-bound lytic murein transglycosylase D
MTSSYCRGAPVRTAIARAALSACVLAFAHFPGTACAQESDSPAAPQAATSTLRAGTGSASPTGMNPPQLAEAPEAVRVLTLDLTRDANDIWDRIRRGFGMADLDSKRVMDQQSFYLNRPRFLKQVFERGGRYLYYIVDELERRGMPTELALLPMVESSYNPMAYSRAHASGLWQFIPSTGKHYNLTQDHWVDERRDVIASTNAALDYLQRIYEMHGDWHLALASYNWGEGAVQRALKRNAEDGLPLEYEHLRMPDETRNYVPKLQAIKNIVSEPELFHFELPYVANELHFISVEAPIGVDLATAAKLSGMPLDEFLALNPSFNRPAVTTPGQIFIVPTDRAEQLQQGLAELDEDDGEWRMHVMAAGETLEAVAARHGLSSAELRKLNGLGPGSQPGEGYSLLVPDGIDPDGALEVTSLLPLAATAARQPGLKLNTSSARSGEPRLKTPKVKPRPGDKRPPKRHKGH